MMSSNLGLSSHYHPTEPVLDGVGIFYIVGCGIWTVLISCGMLFLWTKRDIPFLRIRRLKLTFVATYILHLYWVLILIGYTLSPVIPEQLLFWMTSIYYPIGLGLFFVSNAELLEVARLQANFLASNSSGSTLIQRPNAKRTSRGGLGKTWAQFSKLDFSLRMIMLVIVGWLFQISFTIIMWCISRKYHSTWGIEGTEVTGSWWQQYIGQAQGFEWWPAIAWQFFWYWIVAPAILWRARHIRDNHNWFSQTSVCCISVFFTLPLWLMGLYVPGMWPCNRFWSPLSWVGVSIWFIQAFTVWIPCYQVLRHRTLQQETLDAIIHWESRTRNDENDEMVEGRQPTSRLPTAVTQSYEKMDSLEMGREPITSFENHSLESLFTMRALEHTLARNPEPLRRFAATRDFSGENIAFLTAVREWQDLWPKLHSPPDAAGRITITRRALYNRAVHLYASYVSATHAVFPINLSARDYHKLESLFGTAAHTLFGESENSSIDDITPFGNGSDEMERANSSHRGDDSLFSGADIQMQQDVDFISAHVEYHGVIPHDFDSTCFNASEKSIKYLVLTNTWPKYLKESRPGSSNSNSEGSNSSSPKRSSPFGGFFSFRSTSS